MTKKEMMEELEILENRRFLLAMKDTWNSEDFDLDREMATKIFQLEKELGA